MVFSKQTKDEIAGQLVYDGKLAGSSSQPATHFSAKKSDDMLSIKIEIGGNKIVVQKGYGSRSKEFSIDYDDESSSKLLGENECNPLRELISALATATQDSDFNGTLIGVINYLLSWPEHRPLALKMDEEKVVIGTGADEISINNGLNSN